MTLSITKLYADELDFTSAQLDGIRQSIMTFLNITKLAGGDLQTGGIRGSVIESGAITASKIAQDTIDTDNFGSSSVTGDKVKDDAITQAKRAATTITTDGSDPGAGGICKSSATSSYSAAYDDEEDEDGIQSSKMAFRRDGSTVDTFWFDAKATPSTYDALAYSHQSTLDLDVVDTAGTYTYTVAHRNNNNIQLQTNITNLSCEITTLGGPVQLWLESTGTDSYLRDDTSARNIEAHQMRLCAREVI